MGRLAAVCAWEGEGRCLGHPPLTPYWPVVQVAPVPVAINPIPLEALDRWGSHCAAGEGVEPLASNCCCFIGEPVTTLYAAAGNPHMCC